MKRLNEYCTQVRRYGPSKGHAIYEIEPGDDEDAIEEFIATMTLTERRWHEIHYSNPQRVTEFRVSHILKYKGDLLVFDTDREYLD